MPTREGPKFAYLLKRSDDATMTAGWTAFMADREWSAIKADTHKHHGAIMGDIEDRTLRSTDYSPRFVGTPWEKTTC